MIKPPCPKSLALLLGLCIALSPILAQAESCVEYFTSRWGNALDMNSSEDILSAFPPNDRSQLTNYSFSGGIFSLLTTGNDPWFKVLMRAIPGSVVDETTRYGDLKPINSSFYKQLRIRMLVSSPSALQVIWEKPSGEIGGSNLVTTTPGWQTYTVNLDVANWSSGGEVHSLRIDPTTVSGETVQIDFIELVPSGCDAPETRVARFRQPDREGGEDYFVAVKGNPANFDSLTDIEAMSGNSLAKIYPSNSYTDSLGTSRRQDYLEALNNSGNGDPTVHLVFPGVGPRIDASRYKIACWTFDILKPVTEFHSLVRFIWNLDGVNMGTDDIVTRFTGEARYCSRLDNVATEPATPQGANHPWRNNADGSGINFFRFDPHESDEPMGYRLTDVRLAADHEADKKFALVIEDDRSSQVDLYYRRGSEGLTLITSLPPARSSDVFIWNTEGLPEGTYNLSSRVGLTEFSAPGQIVVEHSSRAGDGEAPKLQIDGPQNSHNFNGSIQVVGYSVDNRKLATIETHIDGIFFDSFTPANFDARARDAFPQFPYTSESGFNRTLNTSTLASGAHTLTVTAYDTAGNTSSYTASITKSGSGAPGDFTPPFQEGTPQDVPQGVSSTPDGNSPSRKPRFSTSLKGSVISFSATAQGTCPTLRIIGATTRQLLTTGARIIRTSSSSSIQGKSSGLSKLKGRKGTKIYFAADCGANSASAVTSIDPTRIASRRSTSSLSSLLNQIANKFK